MDEDKTKCDFCSRPFQFYTTQHWALYCDSSQCIEAADEVVLKMNIEMERAQNEYYSRRADV